VTKNFRLDAVALTTTEGDVRYSFPSDLTVLAGPTGVGKTTLLEMIKFAFGGNALLAPVVLQNVNEVTIDVTIENERLQISRSVDQGKQKVVRVVDLVTRERLPDHHVDNRQPSLNTLLLTALGLPDDMKAAARAGNSSNAGSRITFADIFSFLYIPQSEINRDIASSQDSYLEPKRKTVFELLFGITNPGIVGMRSRLNTLNGEITEAANNRKVVLTFLADSNTTNRIDAETALAAATSAQRAAESQRAVLREGLDPVADRETQVLRDLLSDAERSLAEAKARVEDVERQQADFTGERRRIQSDIDRLARLRDAGQRLASIEFSVCPRCMQSLTNRHVPDSACRVCLQPDPVGDSSGSDQYETRQLKEQLGELDFQLAQITGQRDATKSLVVDRKKLVRELTATIEHRTESRITPRLQAFSDASDRLATAVAQQAHLEAVLRQWDRVDDLAAAEEELRAERERIKTAIDESGGRMEQRREKLLADLDKEFQKAVSTLGIPGVERASIHPTNYLPLLNGKPFSSFSRGGGIVTATQVAYWTSLLAVALRMRDTSYPAFLLIDSPRLALNTAENLAEALYRRLVGQADANPGRLQYIVADNELPQTYRRSYSEIDFTYDNPTVATVHHPGPAAVTTIGTEAEDEDDD
jgi:hypothetical protein